METDAGRCPNCREAYDETKLLAIQSLKTDDLSEDAANRKKKKKGERKRGIKLSGQERRNLQELRILQKNLVYAVGLSLDICIESVLAQNEFFGQFGPIKKISVNRSSPYSSGQSRNGPTGAAYVTFENDDDAANCVSVIDGAVWDGHYIRACFGTTKYCQAFLKGAQCNNPDCLYMHYLVNEGTFTKEEMNSGFSKGKPAFYHLINFDRSKGPVPGSLAKPPKGPGPVRKEAQLRMQGIDSDAKDRLVQDVDWPHLSQKGRASLEAVNTERLSLEMERAALISRKSVDGSWTSSALRATQSGSAFVPSALQSQASSQKEKKLVVLTSPTNKKVTTRPSRGALPSPSEHPYGHDESGNRLIPKLSADSNLSHVSFQSDDQQSLESDIPGLYVPPHAAAENRLRATKSALPRDEDPARDFSSMQAMIQRRVSVPERMIDQATAGLLSSASGRRGPPPGFNKLQSRLSAQEVAENVASSRLLQTRLSLEAAAVQQRQSATDSILGQIAQNMLGAQPNIDHLSASLLTQNHGADLAFKNQGFSGNMESPFGGPVGGQQNVGQTNPNYPLGCNADLQPDLLQSLISVSGGLALYPLQGKSSTQLSGRGSVPTMQTRLSADAIDRTAVFDFESLQKSQMADGNQAHALNALLSMRGASGIPGQPTAKLEAERLVRQQNLGLARNTHVAPSPFGDPAVLAFKKPGHQDLYQMGNTGDRVSEHLMPVREHNVMPATPFDDPSGGTGGIWASGMNMPATPFMAPPLQPAEMNRAQWASAATSVAHKGAGTQPYNHPVSDQVIDTAGFFCPDQVSSTQT